MCGAAANEAFLRNMAHAPVECCGGPCGAAGQISVYGDVQGAYGFNELGLPGCGLLNLILCCNRPLWYGNGRCGKMNCGDGMAFNEDWRVRNRDLRLRFERELNGPDVANAVAGGMAACSPPRLRAFRYLNDVWCKRVNESLLAPAGHACVLHRWVTTSTNDKGQESKQEHWSMVIVKGLLLTGPPTLSFAELKSTVPLRERLRLAAHVDVDDVQGVYAYNNECACCDGADAKMWYMATDSIACCKQVGLPEPSADWDARDRALRLRFERELAGPDTEVALRAAPKDCKACCPAPGCCPNAKAQAKQLNATLCARVNEALLRPAGYECVAVFVDGAPPMPLFIVVVRAGASAGGGTNALRDAAPAVGPATTGPVAATTGTAVATTAGLPQPKGRFAVYGDVQGVYARNPETKCCFGLINRLFCRQPLYNEIEFNVAWGLHDRADLRARFERELNGPANARRRREVRMLAHQECAECDRCGPTSENPCCDVRVDPVSWAEVMNATWCARMNAELLGPAGYACVAHHWLDEEVSASITLETMLPPDETWETYDNGRFRPHFRAVMVVVKGPLMVAGRHPGANELPAEGGGAVTTGPAPAVVPAVAHSQGRTVTLPVTRPVVADEPLGPSGAVLARSGLPAAAVVPVTTAPVPYSAAAHASSRGIVLL